MSDLTTNTTHAEQHRRNLELHSIGYIGQAALTGGNADDVARKVRSAIDVLLGTTIDPIKEGE